MIRLRLAKPLAVVGLAVLAFGCSDVSPTGPQVPLNADSGLLSGVTGILGSTINVVTGVLYPQGKTVVAVKWAATHPAGEQSASATIGYWGGTIVLPGSDFSVTFPVGALSQNTAITIVAKDGEYVAYDMLPHGLKFARPVVAVQRFRNTSIYGTPAANNTFGAYLADGNDQIGAGGAATAVETVLSTTISKVLGLLVVPDSQTWSLNHFSRYILASG